MACCELGDEAARDCDARDEDVEHGDGQHAGEHARPNETLEWGDAEQFEGIELFADLHGREFGPEARAGACRDDETRPDRSEFE